MRVPQSVPSFLCVWHRPLRVLHQDNIGSRSGGVGQTVLCCDLLANQQFPEINFVQFGGRNSVWTKTQGDHTVSRWFQPILIGSPVSTSQQESTLLTQSGDGLQFIEGDSKGRVLTVAARVSVVSTELFSSAASLGWWASSRFRPTTAMGQLEAFAPLSRDLWFPVEG